MNILKPHNPPGFYFMYDTADWPAGDQVRGIRNIEPRAVHAHVSIQSIVQGPLP